MMLINFVFQTQHPGQPSGQASLFTLLAGAEWLLGCPPLPLRVPQVLQASHQPLLQTQLEPDWVWALLLPPDQRGAARPSDLPVQPAGQLTVPPARAGRRLQIGYLRL